jgi:hypothetical protein
MRKTVLWITKKGFNQCIFWSRYDNKASWRRDWSKQQFTIKKSFECKSEKEILFCVFALRVLIGYHICASILTSSSASQTVEISHPFYSRFLLLHRSLGPCFSNDGTCFLWCNPLLNQVIVRRPFLSILEAILE